LKQDDEDDIPPGIRHALERATDRTPPLGVPYDISAVDGRMYRISEEVVRRERAAEMRACENEPGGPVFKVNERIDGMEADVETIKETLSEYRGQSKRDMVWLKVIGIFITVSALGLGAANLFKRDATAATQAAIMEEIRSLRIEVRRGSEQ